jgi:nucleotide-binding universal stress UspA family protein
MFKHILIPLDGSQAAELSDGVRTDVRHGKVVEEIVGATGDVGADLIALSTHGEPARPAVPCGSVAGRVVLAATRPVLVIGAFADDAGHTPSRPARILVALDGSTESEASLPPARSAAADSAVVEWQAQETESIRRRLRELADGLGREGIRARPLLTRGEPAREIVAQVLRRQAGLLCLSTAGRGAMARMLFGAVAQKLIGAPPVPTMIVRAAPSRSA